MGEFVPHDFGQRSLHPADGWRELRRMGRARFARGVGIALTVGGCGVGLGCGGPFTRVDFDYTSYSYIEPSRSVVTVDGDPETVAFKISAIMREAGAAIIRREQVDEIATIPDDAEACWKADREIALAEFAAYRANEFAAYKDIDREGTFTKHGVQPGCSLVKTEKRPGTKAWFIKAELDERSASTRFQRLKSFAMSVDPQGGRYSASGERENVSRTIGFSSRITFHLWPEGEKRTNVLVKAFPAQGNVEACGTCYVGHDFWQQVTAVREADLARNYLALLEELSREGAFVSPPARNNDAGPGEKPASQPAAAAPACTPGQSVAYAGPGGCQGFQVCAKDGASFEPCICTSRQEKD